MRALQVLDLGCGQGWFSRELALRGAVVVAIDLAENLLAYAREHERDRPLGIEYHLLSAASAHLRWPNRFNLVTGCMSLHDMSAPSAVRCCPVRMGLCSPAAGWSFRYLTPAQTRHTENGCGMQAGSSSPS